MLIKITSSDNSRLKLIRKLGTRKGRSEEALFVVEGKNLITEIIDKGIDVRFILIPEDAGDAGSELIHRCIESPDITVCSVASGEFEKLTDAANGIGMLAVVKMPAYGTDIIERLRPEDNVLVLDRIQDPGNMGTLIRTAAAAGYKAVIAMKGTADVYSPKVLRATAGMIFEIPVIYMSSYKELRNLLSGNSKKIAVTVVDNGTMYYEADLSKGTALVIGNEGNGISDEMAEIADIKVTLPMKGNVESLNAAVAAAILMYESVRR